MSLLHTENSAKQPVLCRHQLCPRRRWMLLEHPFPHPTSSTIWLWTLVEQLWRLSPLEVSPIRPIRPRPQLTRSVLPTWLRGKTSDDFKVGTQMPLVTHGVDPQALTLTLEATGPGSGIATIEYSVDGGATWTAYMETIKAGGDGVSVDYRLMDKAGLVSDSNVDAVIAPVDTTQPPAPSLSAPTSAVAGSATTFTAKNLIAGEYTCTGQIFGTLATGADGPGYLQKIGEAWSGKGDWIVAERTMAEGETVVDITNDAGYSHGVD